MAEQQLVDYIKKARSAGQTDDQTRNLLYKNGWAGAEVSDALDLLNQPQPSPQVAEQPKPETEPQLQTVSQPQPQVVSQPIEPKVTPQNPPSLENDMPRTKKSRGTLGVILKLLIVLIIVAVLGGVGYFAAGQYINLPWNPLRPNPETVINNMLTNMKNVKSSHTIVQADVSAVGSNKISQGKLSLIMNGDNDITDIANPKTNFTFSINLTSPSLATSATASLNVVSVGGAVYLKINNATIPNADSYPGVSISQITGKWFKIDQDSIKAIAAAQGASVQIPTNILPANNSGLTKKIQDLVLAENMFSASNQLGDTTVNGQNVYHYLTTISKDKLKDLTGKIIDLQSQEASTSQNTGATGSSSALVLNMVKAFANTFIDAMGDINIEMWIGKQDYMLYEAKVDKAIDLSKVIPSVNMQVELKLNETNSNFNKPITVQAPTDFQKIENIVLPLLKMQMVKSDMSQIAFIATESNTLNNSYYSLCSRGLLNGYLATYGTELVSLNNDMVSQGAKKPACFSSAANYCVSTQLPDGSYFCIGNNIAQGTTECVSAQTVCK